MSNITSIPQYCSQVVHSVVQYSIWKFILGMLFAMYAFTFGDGAQTVLEAISLLIFFDFLTAIMKAKMTGDPIQSWKVFRSALKFFLYMMMIGGCHLVQVIVPQVGNFATDVMAAFLAVTELISILENVGAMGFEIPLKLLNALQNSQKSR